MRPLLCTRCGLCVEPCPFAFIRMTLFSPGVHDWRLSYCTVAPSGEAV
jgi:ferredoxin